MPKRTIVLFWGAVAAAAFFLGSAWTAAGRLGSGPHAAANATVLGIAIAGFVATALVAGRIAFVIGRVQRQARALRAPRSARVARSDRNGHQQVNPSRDASQVGGDRHHVRDQQDGHRTNQGPDVLEGRIEPGRVFDRAVPLDEVPDGYQAMNDREAIKVLIDL